MLAKVALFVVYLIYFQYLCTENRLILTIKTYRMMKKFFSFALVLVLGMAMQTFATTVNYTADNTSIFRNPERGFTEEISGKISDSNNHLLVGNEDFFDESGVRPTESLVVILYNLYNYKTKALSNAMLQGFNDDMQVLRNKGFKCVLRFAYSESDKNDATKDQVVAHIAQLKPYLAANADVIYVLEAGFVGEWGEWYYSANFGNETQHLNDNRRAVITALLDACPSNRFLLVRYPHIKVEYLGSTSNPSTTPLSSTEAFTGTNRARIGHHNDAFLNSYGNDGTYASWDMNTSDASAVRQYIASETLYVPNGGETNVESSSTANKVYNKAETEMSTYHWSFCGESYAEAVTNKWKSEGIFDNLNRKMGYRYQLVTATFPASANAGGKANINMQIKNVGYAPLYNERHAYIVLKNGNKTYSVQLQSDPRRWLPNDAVTTINEQITIPSNVPTGTYQLYLNMPDAASTLANNPKFSIRFANTNVWDANTGMNNLNASITITAGSSPEPDPDPEPEPDPTPTGDAVVLPATLNKANVASYSSDMTWYNTDYFNFGPEDAENLDRWAEWTVNLKYPGEYIVSEVGYCENGHSYSLELMNGTSVVSSFTAVDDGHWGGGAQSYTQATMWNLSAVAKGTYTLRVKNATAWGQPKLQSLTLQYNGELPGDEPGDDPVNPQPGDDPTPSTGSTVVYNWSNVEAEQVGITFYGASGVEISTVKIHNNKDAVSGVKFSSSYAYSGGKYMAIKPAAGGFKAGDTLSIAACFNNSDDTKMARIKVLGANGSDSLFCTNNGINGRLVADEPVVEKYILAADQDSLLLGRYGNTSTFVTLLKVVRPSSGSEQPGDDPVNPQPGDDPTPSTGDITIDGNFSDWSNLIGDVQAVLPSGASNTGLYSMRWYANASDIFYYLEYDASTSHIDILLSTDGNSNTGHNSWMWTNSAAEYLIEGEPDSFGDAWLAAFDNSQSQDSWDEGWSDTNIADYQTVSSPTTLSNGHKAIEGMISQAQLSSISELRVGVFTMDANWNETGLLPQGAGGAAVEMLLVPIQKTTTGFERTNEEFNNQAYDILGRPVNADYRGVVIINGKKVLLLH